MPLMWVSSIFMVVLIILMLVEMFFYKGYELMLKEDYNKVEEMKFKW